MKKKIWLIICMCLCLAGLTACAKTDPTTVDYNGYTYEQLESACKETVEMLEAMTDAGMEEYLQDDDGAASLVSSWKAARTDLGAFEGFGDFTITKSGKTLTAEQVVNYEERPLVLTYVYHYTTMEVEDITVDLIYTTGEKMSKAGLNTIMCILTVFLVLILICLVIYAFRIIYVLERKHTHEKNRATAKERVVDQIAQREEQQDELELIAVIAAAIAAATGTSTDDFVVRSIKRRR